jgi:hypothetical protein
VARLPNRGPRQPVTDQGSSAISDLGATFDAHVQAEFQDLDLEATMATMTDDPYVHILVASA